MNLSANNKGIKLNAMHEQPPTPAPYIVLEIKPTITKSVLLSIPYIIEKIAKLITIIIKLMVNVFFYPNVSNFFPR